MPTVGVVMAVPAVMGTCVPLKAAPPEPGVRKAVIHTGCVRMAGSTGSMKPPGRRVRKSLFGSSRDSTLVSSSQLGAKRSAQPPAARIHKSPSSRMKAITAQSRLSFSAARMGMSVSVQRQAYMDRGARIDILIVTRAFNPNTPMVGVDNTARDGES